MFSHHYPNRVVVHENLDKALMLVPTILLLLQIGADFDSKVTKVKSFSTPSSIVTSTIRQYFETPHSNRKKSIEIMALI